MRSIRSGSRRRCRTAGGGEGGPEPAPAPNAGDADVYVYVYAHVQRQPTTQKACQRDEDCREGNICKTNVCQAIELSTNLFPIYYREGSFTETAILYWARKGNPGYTVVFPFYWHYWSPTSDFIAPFYWHFTTAPGTSCVLNVSWSSERGARSFGFWPLFYASNKFGWAVPLLLTFNVGDSKIGNQYGALLGLYWWKRSQKGAFDFGLVPPYVSSRDAAHAFTWVAPLNFYWRNGEDRSLLALPLFYKNEHRGGNSVYTWLGYSRREGREQSGSALWLYWFGRDDAEQVALRRPVPAALELPRRRLVEHRAVPADLELQRAEDEHDRRRPCSSTGATTPSMRTSCSRSGGASATTPRGAGSRLSSRCSSGQRDFKARTSSLFTAAGGYSKDETNGTLGGLIWPVLTFWHRDPTSSTRVVTPLYVSHWSKTEHSMTRLGGAAVLPARGPGRLDDHVLPVGLAVQRRRHRRDRDASPRWAATAPGRATTRPSC